MNEGELREGSKSGPATKGLLLNLLTSTDLIWFYYPALGWGVGLLAHGLSIARFGFFGKDWENRKIKKLMEREAGTNPDPLKEPV